MLVFTEVRVTIMPRISIEVDALRPLNVAVTVAVPGVSPAVTVAIASPFSSVAPRTVIETSLGPDRLKSTVAPSIGIPAGVSSRAFTSVHDSLSAGIFDLSA